jgi:energy-coupling factor transport system ATP-binding protein
MLLRATDLVVRHHASLPPALAGVSLDVAAGELVAVVGANGSGKSTLARALVGLLPLESGSVRGGDAGPARVGLVLQDPAAQLVAATVADEVAMGPQAAGLDPIDVAAVVDQHLRLQQLTTLRARDPGTLSGGQQQRVAVAAIGACDARVLVLDEPTALLDPPSRRAFAASVPELASGRGVVWITQEADEVALCDRVVVLEAGTVAWSGPTAQYVAEPHVANSLGLELPVAARVAEALRVAGVAPAGLGAPISARELVEQLVGGGARG